MGAEAGVLNSEELVCGATWSNPRWETRRGERHGGGEPPPTNHCDETRSSATPATRARSSSRSPRGSSPPRDAAPGLLFIAETSSSPAYLSASVSWRSERRSASSLASSLDIRIRAHACGAAPQRAEFYNGPLEKKPSSNNVLVLCLQ